MELLVNSRATGIAGTVLAAKRRFENPSFMLLKDANNLFFLNSDGTSSSGPFC